MKVASIVLSALVLTGLGATFIAQMPEPEPPTVVVEVIDPLEQARRASFNIDMPTGGGSAVLVGRDALENGSYRYTALTAQHVIEDIVIDIRDNGDKAILEVTLTFQPRFHGAPFQVTLDIESIDWSLPSHDWAAFKFQLDRKIECVPLATKNEFEEITAFEHIYIVACGGPYGQHCRAGVMGATHNTGTRRELQLTSPMPWNQFPNDFFKFSMPIWYGDSGGPIFNKHGKLVGLANAFTIGGGFGGNATHSGVALKAYVILETVSNIEDFFKIEN
tara:strand:+ start:1514 stop:2341 length:828 start_codon:yes stop_codon:yes gene_type:complete